MNNLELYNILDSFKTKGEAYNYFNITPNSKGILKLKYLSNSVNFDLNIYKEKRKPPKKYCKKCGTLLKNKQKIFCNHSCSASYSNKNREIKKETREKISKTLKNKYPKKIKTCKKCGQIKCLNVNICKHSKNWFKNLLPFGFDSNVIGTIDIYKEYFRIKELILKEYYDNKLSPKDISLKYNYIYSSENLLHVLKGFGIKTRKISESVHNAILQGKTTHCINKGKYQFKHGWFKTWDDKKVYYRSSYELNYIKKLNYKKIYFEVEYFRIKYWDSVKCKYRVAIPDIYIKKENKLIEIKSMFTFDKQNMIDRFNEYKKYGYNVILILDNKEYQYNDIFELNENKITINNLKTI